MNISKSILTFCGWTWEDTLLQHDKSIICVAPHTSNWDFIIGQLYYRAAGKRAGFLMKSEWFIGPLDWIFRKIGGIPVYRGKNCSMTDSLIEIAKSAHTFNLAITPEGTRKLQPKWKHGFYYIALGAGIPIQCYAIDFKKKHIKGTLEVIPSGNIKEDMQIILEYYKGTQGKHPNQFALDTINE